MASLSGGDRKATTLVHPAAGRTSSGFVWSREAEACADPALPGTSGVASTSAASLSRNTFDLMVFAQHFVSECGFSVLGYLWLPVCRQLVGPAGVLACGFRPGRFSCGESNYATHGVMVTLFVMLLMLELELALALAHGRPVLVPWDIFSGMVVCLIMRCAIVSAKYAAVQPALLRSVRYGPALPARVVRAVCTDVQMAQMATAPKPLAVYDLLRGAMYERDEPPSTHAFRLLHPVPAERVSALTQSLVALDDQFAEIVSALLPGQRVDRALSVACQSRACLEPLAVTVPESALLLDIVQRTYSELTSTNELRWLGRATWLHIVVLSAVQVMDISDRLVSGVRGLRLRTMAPRGSY